MVQFCPLSTTPIFFQGKPQIGAQITFYDAGTLTPRTAYADGLLHTPLAQPILSDGNGTVPQIWIQGNPYRMRILAPAPNSVLIRDIDNLPGDPPASPPPPPPPSGTITLQTGDLVWAYGTAIIPGRVRANGKTIGNASSGASEFADPTCQNLFVALWQADPNLVVIGGRGPTALVDWNANKAITLPDFNGRGPMGIDGMGSPVTGRLGNALFLTGGPGVLGSTGGESGHTLLTAELPSHTHTATTQSAGSHAHTFTTAVSVLITVTQYTSTDGSHSHGGGTGAAGAYTPTGSTDGQGSHNHGGNTGGRSAAHNHGYNYNAPTSYNAIAGTGAVGGYWYGGPTNVGGTTAGETQDHSHAIGSDGYHAHGLNINALPNHAHSITADGSHYHSLNDTTQPHAHGGTTDSGGAHTHSLSSDPTGGNGVHNTMQPFLLVTFYLIL